MTQKQLVLSTLGRLPDDATLADFEEEFRILKALDQAEDDIKRGRTKPHEDVKRQLASWISG
jgi:predicted transcriptional regulator